MGRIRKRTVRRAEPSDRKVQDQLFEEKLRTVRHLVQVLREAGVSCELDTSSLRTVTLQ